VGGGGGGRTGPGAVFCAWTRRGRGFVGAASWVRCGC